MDQERTRPRSRDGVLSQGQEKGEKYIVVEIGSGKDPLPTVRGVTNAYRGRIHENPDIYYFGVDRNFERLAYGRDKLALMDKVRKFDPHELLFVEAEGENLPFASDSVSEVVLKDVLGDIEVGRKMKEGMIADATRVLKLGGTLKVIERKSPPSQDAVLSLVAVSSEGRLAVADPALVSPEDRGFDEQVLEPLLYPSAFVLRLSKKSA